MYLNLSLAYYRSRDFRAAVRMARQAIALQPDSADAYNNLGAAYAELGEWQAAIDALQTALRLRPDFPLARNNLLWAQSGLRGRR
jgi:Flp pilus assembly protein TadD